MKNLSPLIVLIILMLGMGSCSQTYYQIKPQSIKYNASKQEDNIRLDYRYDVLYATGNNKLFKKEVKNNLKLLAVKITNNSDHVINLGKNAAFYEGDRMIYPLDPMMIRALVGQKSAAYFLYLLFTPLTLSVNNSDDLPIGLLLGPGLSLGNYINASSANKAFLRELIDNDLINTEIQVGETVYGIVGFKNLDYTPICIKSL